MPAVQVAVLWTDVVDNLSISVYATLLLCEVCGTLLGDEADRSMLLVASCRSGVLGRSSVAPQDISVSLSRSPHIWGSAISKLLLKGS